MCDLRWKLDKYYSEKLSAGNLRRCYEIASPRVQQYLEAEIQHVLGYVGACDNVLELGCGYGRILPRIADKAGLVIGIDNSHASLLLGRETVSGISNCVLLAMDAVMLAFRDEVFDLVVCIQNGISAFHVDKRALITESRRVTKAGGTVLFSSYSYKFWDNRLEWFQLQAEAGLLGEIDYEKTGDGVIVCKDGFSATTVGIEDFKSLTGGLGLNSTIEEVDESSVFCRIS